MTLPDTEEYQLNSCQTAGLDIFSKDSLLECERYVRGVQRKLDKAVADGDDIKIRGYVHLLSKKSRAVKILAVHRVCEKNSGKHTAGVDGFAMPAIKKERRKLMESLIDEIDIDKKPSPIRRAYIPKPNGDKRPLGIPTIMDRIIQEIIRISIEPICEYHFQPCSYGFRPKRSCQDAVMNLFTKLSRRGARRWIVEGDIKGCFDHIKHSHITSTLQGWGIPNGIIETIKKMLRAGIMENMTLTPSVEGTPQGGIISPMLANVALTHLDEIMFNSEYAYKTYKKSNKKSNSMIRYADDFVIIAQSEEQAEEIKSYIGKELKHTVGVELSDEKTRITEINKGFDFLGFTIRKYKNGKDETLLIKPSRENVQKVLRNIKETFIYAYKTGMSIDRLIRTLNPIIRGWANYYRHFVAKESFKYITDSMWKMTVSYLMQKYPQRSKKWILQRHMTTVKGDKWVLYDRDTDNYLLKMRMIPVVRYIQVRRDVRVYDSNATDYWEKRELSKTKNSFFGSAILEKLFKRQKGRCDYCKNLISQEDVQESAIHKHHLKPRSEGGDWKLGNLRLLHSECHTSLHSLVSRKDMAKYVDNGIDYLRLLKPQLS